MEKYLKNFKNCLQKEIPFCMAECPFHLDIHDFIEKMKRGGFQGAFKIYRNAVGFPLIASRLCHEPCKSVCPRKDTDGSVELLMLEKACISFTGDRSPTDYNLPLKKKKVAVIGAGISGLACALRLCIKKYEVEIFESSGRIGGFLWELLEPELFLTDLEEQLKYEKYTLHLNTRIRSAEELGRSRFDAVYVATGEGGADFGLLSESALSSPIRGQIKTAGARENSNCALIGNAGWFAGGGLIGEKPVYALANGLYMGTVIDNFLKTGNLTNPPNVQKTCMQLDPARLKQSMAVTIPEKDAVYSREEATREASRCLECRCDFCRTYCDLTDFYNKWPLRIRDEIIATTLPGSAEVKATPAKRLLHTCNQCGLCKEICPEGIDLGGLILEGRKSMHRQRKAPWVFHEFWLRDMAFANGAQASLTGKPERCGNAEEREASEDGNAGPGYAFFPGCQLGASDPELVEKTYEYLVKKRPGTGLLLRCCGAPAEWSGDEEAFNRETETIKCLWEKLGKPILILACPTCEKKFKTYMKEIPVISLYEIINDWGLESGTGAEPWIRPVPDLKELSDASTGQRVFSIFDACAARHEKKMKEAVRTLAKYAGCELEPLPDNDTCARCCSFGGQPGAANPEYVNFVVQKRISESDHPYITYCINCRDVFLDAGKEAVHILELLFGDGNAPEKLATVSQRRENRVRLKGDLLKRYWNEETEGERKSGSSNVRISEELAEKLSRSRILEEDAAEVVVFCERTGRRVFRPERGTYSGYGEIGHTTCWVEYRVPEQGLRDPEKKTAVPGETYELVNAYVHRMKIELESVWNGKKIEAEQ